MTASVYCFDTSALVHAWSRAYPPTNFPTFWVRIEELISKERAISPMEVFFELEKKDDDLFQWAKQRKTMFVDLDVPTQKEVRTILNAHPRLVDTRKQRDGADPMVIALTRVRNAIVVTQEGRTGKLSAPHIPDVCAAMSVPYLDLLGLVRAEGWTM